MRSCLVFVAGLLPWLLGSCASATYIELQVRADSEVCGRLTESGVAATTASAREQVSTHPLTEFQRGCSGGVVGTLIISPSDDDAASRNLRVGIRIVGGLDGKGAVECDDASGVMAEGCIIAWREIQFVEGTGVPLMVTLEGACTHVTCPDGFVCSPTASADQRCVPE